MKHSRTVETCLSASSSRLVLAALLAAGTLSAAPPARADDWQVYDEGDLHFALFNADFGDTITFETNVTLTANLPLVRTGNLTINGQGFTLSGNNQYRGLFVQSDSVAINVAINDLTITDAKAQGGRGGDARFAVPGNPSHGGGGGGGAGLGGALFVGSGANVTVSNVNLQTNLARGGNGGAVGPYTSFNAGTSGGGGGYWPAGADGGDGGPSVSGGGGAPDSAGGDGSQTDASPGGFGGGGGGSGWCYDDGDCPYIPGSGGFGGGSGGGSSGVGAAGGFGGGNGTSSDASGGGGGGAGFGGAIFVQQGGSLSLAGSLTISGNAVAGGDGGRKQGEGNATGGRGIGSGIFLHGNGSFSVAPGAGQTQTISDIIIDQTGAGGTGADSGSWSLVKNGDGTTILTGANAYSGGTTVNAGILLGNTSSLKGNITNNASVIFDQAGEGTYAGNMSGSGALFKRGSGVLSLTGTNTYAAGTRVEEGTLRIASDDKLGAAGTHLNLDGGGGLSAAATFTSTRPVWLTGAGGTILVDAGETLTLSGVVSESGALVKSGGGDLILSGANTYLGGTTVTGGVLRFTTDASLGAAATEITLNGGAVGTTTSTPAATSIGRNITLADNGGGIAVAAQPLTWSGNISGNGGLFKMGAGELELTGANTYAGGTQVAGGTLRIAADANLGAAGTHIDLNNGGLRASETFTSARPVGLLGVGGVVRVDANKTLTLSGIVHGSGSLTKVGDGTLILTGGNTYAGTIFDNGGTVQGNATSLRGNIVFDPNASNPSIRSVIFDQATNGIYAGNITGLGSLTKTGAGTLILVGAANYTGGTTVSAGALQGTTFSLQGNILNNAAIIFDQPFDGTYAGTMTGTGTLTKNGTGALVLTGNNTYTGATTVNAGALLVNGSSVWSSLTTVNAGGTLGGTGGVGSVTLAGGRLSPGNSIGTINIIGNLVFGAGSVYAVEVSGSTADRANATGSADLSGGTVDVTFLPGGTVSRSYTILNATGGLGGTEFAGLSDTPLPGFKTSLAYDADNVYLVSATDRTDPDFGALNQNQLAVADEVLGHFDANGTLRSEFVALNANGLSTASGEIAAGAIIAGIDSADRFLAALDGQGEGGVSSAEGASAAAYAEEDKPAGEGSFAALDMSASHAADPVDVVIARRWSAWGSAYGGTENTGGDPFVGSHDTDARTYGLVGGVSYRLDDTLLGIALGGGWSDFSLADGLGSGDAGTFNAGVYGRQGFGNAYLSGALAYGFHAVETTRSVPGDTLTGEFDAHTFSGRAEAGYRFETPVVAISPYAAFQAISYHLPAYSETSSGSGAFALDYDSDTTTATRVELGARLDHAIALDDGARLTLSGRAAWAINNETDRNFSAGFQSLPGTSFTIDGAEPDRNSLLVDAGAEYNSPSGFFVAAAFQGEFSGNVESYSGKVKLGITW